MPGARAQTNESLTRVIAPRTGTETGTETGTGTKAPRHQGPRNQGPRNRDHRKSLRGFWAGFHYPSDPAAVSRLPYPLSMPSPLSMARRRHLLALASSATLLATLPPFARPVHAAAPSGAGTSPEVGARPPRHEGVTPGSPLSADATPNSPPPWAARPPTGCFRAPSATGQAAPRWNGPLSGWRYCPPARQTGC